MPIQQKIFALTLGVGLFVVIIEMVRRRKLAEEFSFLWLLIGFGIVLFVLWYDPFVWITNLLAAKTPITVLFIFGFMALLLINLLYSIRITKLSAQIKELAQKMALDENKR